jgi:hypothetical protein
MKDTDSTDGFYSAKIRMHLAVNGYKLTIGQLGPDFLILDHPTDHPPSEAEIHLSIDDRARSWFVDLPDGIIAGQRETRICRVTGKIGANDSIQK